MDWNRNPDRPLLSCTTTLWLKILQLQNFNVIAYQVGS